MTEVKEKYMDLLVGSSVLATGGGGDLDKAVELFSGIPDDIEIVSPGELKDSASIAMAYGFGSTKEEEKNKERAIRRALERYTEKYGDRIDAVIPGELGPTQVYAAFQAAEILDVPVLDTDTEGGRCVPSIDMSFLRFDSEEEVPIVISDGETDIYIEEKLAISELEDRLRQISRDLGLIGGFGHQREIGDLKSFLVDGTLSTAEKVGKRLREEGYESLDGFYGIRLVDEVEIDRIIEGREDGFYTAEIRAGRYSINVVNEYLELHREDKQIARVPESICLVSLEDETGIYSSNLEEGMEIAILVKEPLGIWKTGKGRQLFEDYLEKTR